MSRTNWIKRFEPLTSEKLLDAAVQTADWIEQFGHTDKGTEWWDVMPGKEVSDDELLLKKTSLYGGAAGIALFYLRLYIATDDKVWLDRAEAGIRYCIDRYSGADDFKTEFEYLAGAFIGYLNGPAGGAYTALQLYKATGREEYRSFAIRVARNLISAGHEEDGAFTWYGTYGIIGEGSLILYLLEIYDETGDPLFLNTAAKAADYILKFKEESPWGGYRWYVMPTDTFPTIRKAGGYFPGFEYGAAGTGYILAKVYEKMSDEKYLEAAVGAARYIKNIADYSDDKTSALVRYNDTYLTDLYYLGVCQGPVGTSRLFYELYRITGDESYKEFVICLTNGLLDSGAPLVHSEGYWRTNCYCCGGAGMLEHFVNVHKLTGDDRYLSAAYSAAEAVIGESTVNNNLRNWYSAWNRHEPYKSEAYTGLYHGSAGNASALIFFRQYIEKLPALPGYLEDPYRYLLW